ncbi:hypothetical protein FB639_003280 [Coemansia asiatica]|nr:hypothetical protein FB639_003280 [Coemansia asiatica]
MKEHSGIVNMLVPKCDSKRAEAERVASLVISQLERVINGADDLQETASVESPHDLFTDDLANSNSNNNSSSAGDTSFLKLIQKSISNNNSQPAQKFRREPEMYPVIASLFRFTEDLITKFAHTQDSTDKSPSQSVKVYSKTDVSPKDSDNYLRIDLGLFLNDMWERPAFDDSLVREDKDFEIGAIDPRYADIFAVIEAKVSENDQAHAYKQLLLYTYNIYWRQHDRRFAWGLTVCDSIVRACVIGNDGALASERMDLTEIDGRSTFVQLLVNMSYCGREQLGFDPTIRHNRAKSLWEIDVYNDSDNSKTTCEIVSVMQAADRLFGRHTRCFKCKLADDSLNLGHFIVKDAWAYAECDSDMADLRDEVSILRDINEQLGADASLEGTIPKLHWGGVVKITAQDGFTADDISDPLFKILDGEDSTKHHRVHKRLAMGPIGEPLRKAKSIMTALSV